MTTNEKAARYDEIVKQSLYYFEAWQNEHKLMLKKSHTPNLFSEDRRYFAQLAQRYASMAHEHYSVLKLAEVAVVCNCNYCQYANELVNVSPERLRKWEQETR